MWVQLNSTAHNHRNNNYLELKNKPTPNYKNFLDDTGHRQAKNK